MRRALSPASLTAVRINELVIFIVIGALSLVVGIWIPRDWDALAVALVAVTIGVVVAFRIWHGVVRRRSQLGAAGLSGAAQPLRSRDYLVPRELPPGPADFVGRHEELQRLEAAINRPRDADPFIAVIYGAPGIGKSALSIAFARKIAPSFPAGQLFVQMHGATDLPGKAEDLIEYFVVALKGPGDLAPTDGGELRDKYRELTMGRSVLFVLDDIPVNLDIDALRLASPTCAFIVTCREKPEWPAARECIALGELAESEAMSMLRASIGDDRVNNEEEPSRDLASLCGRQPQALLATGTAVANRPDWDISLILEQTQAALKHKARQRGGTFDAAYALLTADEQRALQVLGALDRPQIRPWMLAAALGTSEAAGHRLASRLADAGLIERYNPGSGTPSYRVEDPILQYASLQVADAAFADAVRSMVNAAERDQGDESLASLDELLRIKGGNSFTSAIGKVRSALSGAQERRSRAGEAEACAALAELYADLGDMIGAEELAHRAIGKSADIEGLDHARARAGRCLLRIERRRHRLDSAIDHANNALASAESANDQPERIRILQEWAVVLAMNELPAEAVAMSEAAFDACGSPAIDGASLRPGVQWSRGTVLLQARRYQDAAAVLADGKREAEEQGQLRMCAWIDLVRAHVAFETCDYDEGERHANAAMDVFTGLRHRYGTAHCRYRLGQISLARGRLEEAGRFLREALETFHNCADSWIEGEVSLVLAQAYRRQGRVRAAIGLQLKARRSYRRMNGQDQAREATRELIRTLLTGPPARLRMLWSANSRPDGG